MLFILLAMTVLTACETQSAGIMKNILPSQSSDTIELRKFPYPYQAMLAISTDIDATAIHDFEHTHRFMNTKEDTVMGPGLGLDIANSFWMYVATDREGFIDFKESTTWSEQMSYFKKDWTETFLHEEIKQYIQAGWIDTIHSLGDFSMLDNESSHFTRQHAIEAIDELVQQDIHIKVWVNHGNKSNIQNFGGDYGFTDYQQGDVPDALGYHTDLTIPYGFEFLWDSMGDDQVGYESVLYPITLKDGQKIWGFKRFTNTIEDGNTRWLWGVHFLDEQLSEENLNSIIENGSYFIVSQHLGNQIGDGTFPISAIEALKRIKDYQDRGDILIARTSRLLEYNRNHDHIEYEAIQLENNLEIHINKINDPVIGEFVPSLEQLRGMTFYAENPEAAEIYIDHVKVPKEELVSNESDGIGKSISIKWFAPDYYDYTKK